MNPISGSFSIPRFPADVWKAGSFFSGEVLAHPQKGVWLLKIGTQTFEARSTLQLRVGQSLRLKIAELTAGRVLFQILDPTPRQKPSNEVFSHFPEMAQAFVKQGLPLHLERLAILEKWSRALHPHPGKTIRDWATTLDSKNLFDQKLVREKIEPWVTWEMQVEQGNRPDFPEESEGDADLWDLWNAKKARGDFQWFVFPIEWEWKNHKDRGLFKSLWNGLKQKLHFWSLTTVAAETPFQLRMQVPPNGPAIFEWCFFRKKDFAFFEKYAKFLLDEFVKRDQTLKFELKLTFGPNEVQQEPYEPWKEVDEQV